MKEKDNKGEKGVLEEERCKGRERSRSKRKRDTEREMKSK